MENQFRNYQLLFKQDLEDISKKTQFLRERIKMYLKKNVKLSKFY